MGKHEILFLNRTSSLYRRW